MLLFPKSKITNGLEYEQYCTNYLHSHGYKNIQTTKASGDHGADIIAYRHRKKYAVQCKYYSSPVGNKAIQEIYTGMALYNCDCGIIITNSTFTKQAIAEALALNIILMPMVEPRHFSFPVKIFVIIFIASILCYEGAVSTVLLIIGTAIILYLLNKLYTKYLKQKICDFIVDLKASVKPKELHFNPVEENDITTSNIPSENSNEHTVDNLSVEIPYTELKTPVNLDKPFQNTVQKALNDSKKGTDNSTEVNNITFCNTNKQLDNITSSATFENVQVEKYIASNPHTISENANEKVKKKVHNKNSRKPLSSYELERFAIMCNAQLEHEDEMKQYNQNE